VFEAATPEHALGEDAMAKAEPTLEEQCASKGMRMTDQRRVIAQVIEASDDHPDVEELHRRAADIDPKISLSTVYRTVNLFEEAGLVTKHDFKDGRARFEPIPDEHHDHLIDIRSGKVIEFRNEEIEAIQELIAKRLGYRLVDHRLELYAVPSAPKDSPKK
jgi:Fur family ferric uptake transcriptional regulator